MKTLVEVDALGRVRLQRLPDGSTRTSTYLAGGGLAAVTMSTADGKVTGLTVFDGDVGAYRRVTIFEAGLGRPTKSICYKRVGTRS